MENSPLPGSAGRFGYPSGDFDLMYNVAPHRHLYQFYKNSEDYLKVMTSFFRTGLEKGEGCLWIASEKMDIRNIHAYGEEVIPRFLYYLCSEQIQIVSAEQWYLRNGRFDEEQAISNAQQMIQAMTHKGFHRVRAGGDASAIPHEDWHLLESYEHKITDMVRQVPITALCAFPIFDCALSETKMIVDAHDDVLVGHL